MGRFLDAYLKYKATTSFEERNENLQKSIERSQESGISLNELLLSLESQPISFDATYKSSGDSLYCPLNTQLALAA